MLDIMGVRCPTSLPSRVPETLAYSAKEDDTGKNSKIQAGQMANTWSLGCQVPTACFLTPPPPRQLPGPPLTVWLVLGCPLHDAQQLT